MTILGSNSPGGLVRKLKDGQNGSISVVLRIVPANDMVVNTFSFYARGEHNQYWSGVYGVIGTITGNTLTVVPCGDAVPAYSGGFGNISTQGTVSRWCSYTFTTEPKPYLVAGTSYYIGIKNLNGSYPTYAYYFTSTTGYNTHGYNTYWAVDEPDRIYSIYLSGEYIQTGPPVKIDNTTPGKLEYTSWANIASLK
jgi:hypothetical protein